MKFTEFKYFKKPTTQYGIHTWGAIIRINPHVWLKT